MIENIRQILKQMSDHDLAEFRTLINREIRFRLHLRLKMKTDWFNELFICMHSDYDLWWMREAHQYEEMSRTIPAFTQKTDEQITQRVNQDMQERKKNQNWNNPEG